MSKVLIIGSNGQLGFDLIEVLKEGYEIIPVTRDNFDVTNDKEVEDFIKNAGPDIVINTAAYHKTEECERNPEKSFQVNALGAYNVAKAAAAVGAKIIFFSTDYVFDGSKKNFNEENQPNPLNIYGASKLAGEILTRIANENCYIIRTAGIFGVNHPSKGYNFVTLMLEKARNGEEIKVVDDLFVSPTYAFDLAVKIKELVDKKSPAGIYHVINSGSCSWFNFAKRIFELTNIRANLKSIGSDELPSNMKRPRYSVLISTKLGSAGIENLRPWQEALADYLKILNF